MRGPSAGMCGLLGLLIVLASSEAHAEACRERPNALVADLGMHVVNAGYQRTLGCHVSAQLSAGLYGPWTVNQDVLGLAGGARDDDVVGVVVRARAFVYPTASAPVGLWLSPFVQAGPVAGTRRAQQLDGSAFAVGISVGWTWRFAGRWLFAVGLGGQYHRVSFAGSTARPGFSLPAPQLDVNLDYEF